MEYAKNLTIQNFNMTTRAFIDLRIIKGKTNQVSYM